MAESKQPDPPSVWQNSVCLVYVHVCQSVCLVCACVLVGLSCVSVGLPCMCMCVSRSALCVHVCWSVCLVYQSVCLVCACVSVGLPCMCMCVGRPAVCVHLSISLLCVHVSLNRELCVPTFEHVMLANKINIFFMYVAPIHISVDCANFVNLYEIKLNQIVVLPLHGAGENVISYLVQPH